MKFCDDEFYIVNSYKYLGHIIERNLLDVLDVKLRLRHFYSSFNYVFRNFKNVSIDIVLYVSHSFRLPGYSLEM